MLSLFFACGVSDTEEILINGTSYKITDTSCSYDGAPRLIISFDFESGDGITFSGVGISHGVDARIIASDATNIRIVTLSNEGRFVTADLTNEEVILNINWQGDTSVTGIISIETAFTASNPESEVSVPKQQINFSCAAEATIFQ